MPPSKGATSCDHHHRPVMEARVVHVLLNARMVTTAGLGSRRMAGWPGRDAGPTRERAAPDAEAEG